MKTRCVLTVRLLKRAFFPAALQFFTNLNTLGKLPDCKMDGVSNKILTGLGFLAVEKMTEKTVSGSGVERMLFYGLCALFFFLPVSISPLSIVEGLLLAVWVLSGRFLKDAGLALQKWGWPVLVMMALPWIGLLYSGDTAIGFKFAQRSDYWLFTFIVAGVLVAGYGTEAFFKSFIAGVTFTSLVFLGQVAGLIYRANQYEDAFFGKWGHIELSQLTTLSILLLSFYFAESRKRSHKALCAGLMAVQFAALAMLLTDAGQAAIILLSPVIFYNILGRSRKRLKFAFAAGLLLVGVIFLSPVVQSRLKEVVSDTANYSRGIVLTPLGFHYYLWGMAVRIFRMHPFAGAGTGGYAYLMDRMRQSGLPRASQPQNTFLYMAASYGLPGILAVIWLWAVPVGTGWKRRHAVYGFAMISFMAILTVGSMTDTQIMSHQSGMLLALFYGMCLAAGKGAPALERA